MKFIFWQNIISIHQSAFLKSLAKHHDVMLVVEQTIENERETQGWSVPDMDNVKIATKPDGNEISVLLVKDAIHIFSGINVYPLLTNAFNIAVNRKLKIGIFMEPFRSDGIKGFIRNFKYLFLRIKYRNSIDFILATGEKACIEYQKVGFKADSIFNWAYYVEAFKNRETNSTSDINELPNILFVGSLDKRKNILQLIKACMKLTEHFNELIIIGDGPLKKEVISKISNFKSIKYLGNQSNTEVISYMTHSDILVLPSLFDGWGAVVNEALHSGIQVIASANCGASILLDGEIRGEKFLFNDNNNLETVLLKWLLKGPVSQERRQEIKAWSSSYISGEAAAIYFTNIVDYIYSTETTKPVAPWIENR